MVVDFACDRLRAVLDQERDDRAIAAFGGKMQWKRVVSLVADVRVRAAIEKELDDRFMLDAEVEGGTQTRVPHQRAALVDDLRMRVEHRTDARGISGVSRREQHLARRVSRRGVTARLNLRDGGSQFLPVRESVFDGKRVLHVA